MSKTNPKPKTESVKDWRLTFRDALAASMRVTIEGGVPIPEQVRNDGNSSWGHLLESMQVGQSFLVEEYKSRAIELQAEERGILIAIANASTDKEHLVRVWKV